MEPRKPPFPKLTQRFLQAKMRVQQKTQSIYDEHFSEAQMAKKAHSRLSEGGLEALTGSDAGCMITNLLSAPNPNVVRPLPDSRPADSELHVLKSRLLFPKSEEREHYSGPTALELLNSIECNFEKFLKPARSNRLAQIAKRSTVSASKRASTGLTGSKPKSKRSKRVKTESGARRLNPASPNLVVDKHEILEIGDILGTGTKDLPEVDN